MAAGPAEVSFPGDKNRKKRIRMRGIKKALKEIQQRLDRNLEALLDDPEIFLPEIRAELGKPRKDAVAATLKEVDSVSQKRHDRRWLTKRMTKRRGDLVCRSLAGSLLAEGDANISTVSVYNSPIYGTTSYVRRGNRKQSHMVGIQNFTNPRMRLLVWDDHAKAGNWFFSWHGVSSAPERSRRPPPNGSMNVSIRRASTCLAMMFAGRGGLRKKSSNLLG